MSQTPNLQSTAASDTNTTMRLLRVTGPYRCVWEERALREPRATEVQIKTILSAISVSSELSLVERGLNMELGYQTLGVVVKAGRFAGAVSVGQRVLTTLGHASHENKLAPLVIQVPDHVSNMVALCAILGEESDKGVRTMAPQPNEKILIAGAGMLGLLSVFNLTRRGVKDVTVLEPDPQRRNLARLLGARAVHGPGDLPTDDYDMGLECSAAPAGFSELMSHVKPGGRICVLSDGNWGELSLPIDFHRRELTLIASHAGEDYKKYAEWLWQNADPVLERLFEQVISPQYLPDIFPKIREFPRPVAVLVNWE